MFTFFVLVTFLPIHVYAKRSVVSTYLSQHSISVRPTVILITCLLSTGLCFYEFGYQCGFACLHACISIYLCILSVCRHVWMTVCMNISLREYCWYVLCASLCLFVSKLVNQHKISSHFSPECLQKSFI